MSEHRGPLEEMENVPDANHLCGNNVDTHYERLANTSKSKRSELDPPGFPSAAQQISQSIYVCFVVQLWRATWYAWDYWLGFGWLGTLSSLAAGLFIITCFRSTTVLSRLVPVNPDVTVPQRLSDSTPTVTHSSTEQLSVFRYHEHNLSIRRRIPRQVAHIVLVMGCCSAYRGWWLLGDLTARDEAQRPKDMMISFLVGAVGVAFINLSPAAAYLLDDAAASEGG